MGGRTKALEFQTVEYTGVDGKTRRIVGDILDFGDIIKVQTDSGIVEIVKANTIEVKKYSSPTINFFGIRIPKQEI